MKGNVVDLLEGIEKNTLYVRFSVMVESICVMYCMLNIFFEKKTSLNLTDCL